MIPESASSWPQTGAEEGCWDTHANVQYTGAHHDGEAVDGPTPPQMTCDTKERCALRTKHNSTGRLKINRAKKTQKDGDKHAVAILKDSRQLGCVLQDI